MEVSSRLEKADGAWLKHVALQYGKRFAGSPREIYYKSSAGPFAESADDLVALTLLPAMVRGERLLIRGRVSERLLASLPRLQETFRLFGPSFGHSLTRIEVDATDVTSRPLPAGRQVATFFSGGLDSFSTVLRRREELDALVFVHGFDIDVRNTELREGVSRRLQGVAAELQLPLIEVETNIRFFVDRSVHWALYCGSALACLALSLQDEFRKIYIPGSVAFDWLEPWGTHPMLDSLWSTESLEIMADSIDLNRVEKADLISDFDVAQRNLRVCYSNAYGEYNCGHCRKCVLMQMVLASLGVLDRFPVFEAPLSLEAVRRLDLSDGGMRLRAVTCLEAIAARNGDPALRGAIHSALAGWVASYTTPRPRPEFDGDLVARLFPPVSVAREP